MSCPLLSLFFVVVVVVFSYFRYTYCFMSTGSTVYFSGIDIVDGTPVLDIKPFIPQYDVPTCRGDSLTEVSVSVSDHSDNFTFGVGDYSDENTDGGARHVDADANSCSYKHDDINNQTDCVMLEERPGSVAEKDKMEDGECFECATAIGGVCNSRETTAKCDLAVQIPLASPEQPIKLGLSYEGEEGFSTCSKSQKCSNDESVDNSLEKGKKERANYRKRSSEDVMLGDKTAASFQAQNKDGVASPELDSFSTDVPRGKQTDARKLGEFSSRVKQEQNRCLSSKTETSHSGAVADTAVAQWLSAPPVAKLQVTFTPTAEAQLQNFAAQTASSTNPRHRLNFLSGEEEIRTAIVSVLSEDPRSVYRRERCRDSLYFFTVDQVHVTCWFDDDKAEVVRLQPLSCVEKLSAKSC